MNKSSLRMRYGLAVSLLILAVLIRSALGPLLGHHSPFLFFLQAAMLADLFAGFGPGMVTLLGGLVLGDLLFLQPTIGFGHYTVTELTALISYLITGLTAIGIIEGFHRARTRLQRTEAHEKALEAEVAARTATLEQSVKSLEGVLYHVAHDLRAPLRAMHGFSRLLLDNYRSSLDSTGRDYARRISEASLKMDTLVGDLLAYGRLGHQELHPACVDLWALVDSVLLELTPQIHSRQAKIRVDYPSPQVQGDPQILCAILKNLIENALKFIAPGTIPRIHIWAETLENKMRIYVEDNGIGIAPAYHERIFGVFERAHCSEQFPGTGIGLAIVRKGIERLGGRVGVESSVGQGSRFWFELQLAPQPVEEPNADSPRQVESFHGLITHLRGTLCLTQ